MDASETADEVPWLKSPSAARSEKSLISPKSNEPGWVKTPISAKSAKSSSRSPRDFPESGSPQGSVQSLGKRRLVMVDEVFEETTCCCCPTDPVLYWFRIFHFLAGSMGAASLAANAYILTKPGLDFVALALHMYTMLFCAAIVLVEMDWRFFVARVRLLDVWVVRGLFYAFVGFMTMSEDDLSRFSLETTPMTVVGIVQLGFALMYLLMGLTCVKSIEDRRWAAQSGSAPHYVEIPDVATPSNGRETV